MKERPILFSSPMVRAILEGRKTQTRRVVKPQPPSTMTDAICYLDNASWCFTGPQRDGDGNPLPLDQWVGGWPDCSPGFPCPYGIPGDRGESSGGEVHECGTGAHSLGNPARTLQSEGGGPCAQCGVVVDTRYRSCGSRLWVRETWLPCAHGSYEPWPLSRKAPLSPHESFVQYRADLGDDPDYAGFWRPSIFMPRWASRITLEIADVRVQRLQGISEEDAIAEGVKFGTYAPGECRTCARGAFMGLWDSINAKRGFGWDTNPWVWAITFQKLGAA